MFNFKSKTLPSRARPKLHGNYGQHEDDDDDGGQSQVSGNPGLPNSRKTNAENADGTKARKSSTFSKKMHNFRELFRKKHTKSSAAAGASSGLPVPRKTGGFSKEGKIMNENEAEGSSMASNPTTNNDEASTDDDDWGKLLNELESLRLVVASRDMVFFDLDSSPSTKELHLQDNTDGDKPSKFKTCSFIVKEVESKCRRAAAASLADKQRLARLEDSNGYLKTQLDLAQRQSSLSHNADFRLFNQEAESRSRRQTEGKLATNEEGPIQVKVEIKPMELEVEFELAQMNEKSEQQELPFRDIRNNLGGTGTGTESSSAVVEEIRVVVLDSDSEQVARRTDPEDAADGSAWTPL